MEYEPLRKLYYMDEALYAKTYETRFHAEDAVRLDFDIGGFGNWHMPLRGWIKELRI